MNKNYNSNFPDFDDLKRKACQRMPKFAFDYISGGCNQEFGLETNRKSLNNIKLRSELLKPYETTDISVELFGHRYAAPFGIAPVGLQGLMWPKAPEILAKTAAETNIPFILSTVSSSSLEKVAEISEGKAWFQLYNPTSDSIRLDLLNRLKAAEYQVLVVTVDVPTFGYRPKDIRNGLAMPPKMTLKNIFQMMSKPRWLWETMLAGKPEMQTLKPYMPKNMTMDHLAEFMNNTVMGRVDIESLKPIREFWHGPLVIKGLINPLDVKSAIALGADAVVMSNHGARQLDLGESPIDTLAEIKAKFGKDIKIFMDSGIQSGPDITAALASGADFTFLGRLFVYGVGALGQSGGYHCVEMLSRQLRQVIRQLGCQNMNDLPQHLVESNMPTNQNLNT